MILIHPLNIRKLTFKFTYRYRSFWEIFLCVCIIIRILPENEPSLFNLKYVRQPPAPLLKK